MARSLLPVDHLGCMVAADGPSGAGRETGFRSQRLQSDTFEVSGIAGEPSRLDMGRHHRLHRRDEPVLAKGREGSLSVDTLDNDILVEEEAHALNEQNAEQRNEYENYQHLDQRQAKGLSEATVHRTISPREFPCDVTTRQGSGPRTFSYPTARICHVPKVRPRSIIMNSISYKPTSK